MKRLEKSFDDNETLRLSFVFLTFILMIMKYLKIIWYS